jgi:hypothetical protein
MKRLSRRFVLYVLAASLLVFPTLLPAQTSTNASITGLVRDLSGAIVPNVQVSVRNTDTGVVRTTTTNDAAYSAVCDEVIFLRKARRLRTVRLVGRRIVTNTSTL